MEVDSTSTLESYVDSLLSMAGEVVEEEENQISIARNEYLLNDKVGSILQSVLEENPLPYALQDFQKLALHALGSLKNVILVSPTGSGKMIVNYLAISGEPPKKIGLKCHLGKGSKIRLFIFAEFSGF